MNENQVHLNAQQFGFLKPGQFEELMRRVADENDIPINCSCGVCTVGKESSIELSSLVRARIASVTTPQLEKHVNNEEFLVNRAACGRDKAREMSEELLRKFY